MATLDNTTLEHKVQLRRRVLKRLGDVVPFVLETHGGLGAVFRRCYDSIPEGVVMEKDPERAEFLARQRPTWSVYWCDSREVLSWGVGSHVPVTILDVDPYGNPWPTIQAFLRSDREFAERMFVVVNDGVRNRLRINGAKDEVFRKYAERDGPHRLHANYLALCREMMEDSIGERSGYRLADFAGYYCGRQKSMTHYFAELVR